MRSPLGELECPMTTSCFERVLQERQAFFEESSGSGMQALAHSRWLVAFSFLKFVEGDHI